MRENCTSESVRGVSGNGRSYREMRETPQCISYRINSTVSKKHQAMVRDFLIVESSVRSAEPMCLNLKGSGSKKKANGKIFLKHMGMKKQTNF